MSKKKKKTAKESADIEMNRTTGEATAEKAADQGKDTASATGTEIPDSGSKAGKVASEAEKELELMKDKYLRLMAEFDNFRKRTVRERLELMATASRDLMQDLLPVLDDFDRAKKSAEVEGSKEVFPEGVKLVYNKLYRTLEQKGLKEMETNGSVFDPDMHEAITEIPAPTEDMKGKVVDTIEKGYFLKDTIIRYAKVVVGK